MEVKHPFVADPLADSLCRYCHEPVYTDVHVIAGESWTVEIHCQGFQGGAQFFSNAHLAYAGDGPQSVAQAVYDAAVTAVGTFNRQWVATLHPGTDPVAEKAARYDAIMAKVETLGHTSAVTLIDALAGRIAVLERQLTEACQKSQETAQAAYNRDMGRSEGYTGGRVEPLADPPEGAWKWDPSQVIFAGGRPDMPPGLVVHLSADHLTKLLRLLLDTAR